MKKVIVKHRGLFRDRYEVVEIEEGGEAIAALLGLLILPLIFTAAIGFELLKLSVRMTIAAAVGLHHGIDHVFEELYAISPELAGGVAVGVIVWALLLLFNVLGFNG